MWYATAPFVKNASERVFSILKQYKIQLCHKPQFTKQENKSLMQL